MALQTTTNKLLKTRGKHPQDDVKKRRLSIQTYFLSILAINFVFGGYFFSSIFKWGYDDEDIAEERVEDKNDINQFDYLRQREKNHVKQNEIQYHMVFSTGCSPYQHWQSYLFFYQVKKINQPGFITRIASGCTDREADEAQKWHNTHIRSVLSDNFRIHFTPDFSVVRNNEGTKTKKKYKFFNKPFGLKHWIEHGEGLNHVNFQTDHDVIVILVDPDMLLLRPIGADFPIVDNSDQKERKTRVSAGVPFAQKYILGAEWTKFDLTAIAGEASPAKEVSYTEAMEFYPAGPPYIATASDMYKIAVKWAEFAPLLYAKHPVFLAEMYAYCVAAAHLRLPHQILTTLMVSNPLDNDEGWHLSIDSTAPEKICQFASSVSMTKSTLPNILHYCNSYTLGDSFFYKIFLPADFFTCDSPLLAEPPMDLAAKDDYSIPPDLNFMLKKQKNIPPVIVKRNAFMLCALTTLLNEAGEFFKKNHCDGVDGTNVDKTINMQQMKQKP